MKHFSNIRPSTFKVEPQLLWTYHAQGALRSRILESTAGHTVRTQTQIRFYSLRDTATTRNTNRKPSTVALMPEQRRSHDSVAHKLTRPFVTNGHGRWRKAYVALGSNVGDRLEMIEKACQMLSASSDIRILRSSSLYETAPMYVAEQGRFLNGACEIETTLEPLELLDELQSIEKEMGRVKLIDKGPRNIDLDILLYDGQTFSHERLNIPHKLMLEREFVLRPLCDMIPNEPIPSSVEPTTYQNILNSLQPSDPPISTTTPLTPDLWLHAQQPHRKTHIMSILNLTPDSFSDGGLHNANDSTYLTHTISSHVQQGATILDIGGQSSRPNAESITADEETARILPAIRAAKHTAPSLALSIDTYRAAVAHAAIRAGAHIINDISAGQLDPSMLRTVASLGCSVVLMHMRGTPATMTSASNCDYPDGLIASIASELRSRVAEAEAAGIKRWRIILDPGIGFAKTGRQNLEILRRFAELRDAQGLRGLPWVLGSSRKRFIGTLTGRKEARERGWGTAATVAAAVQGGADVVRVHDVEEMRDVVVVADGIWRGGGKNA